MKPQCLLYLSAHQMAAYRWRAGSLTTEGSFDLTAEGVSEFSAYLLRNRKRCFALLANVAEEGFQTETIPFLRGKDRREVIARKLGQVFFNAPLTAAVSLGYEKSQRKNERVLLASLSNYAFLAPWLTAIAENGVALAGMYSLPSLAPTLLRQLRRTDTTCLLLTVQDQSIRQSFIRDGQLLFSRITPLSDSSIVGLAQAFATEAVKLQQYLTSQRLLARGQQVTAFILAHATCRAALQETCADSPMLRFEMLDLAECAQATHFSFSGTESASERLFLNLLVTAPPALQFADDDLRHPYHLALLRSALLWSGTLILGGCLAYAGFRYYETRSVRQETVVLQANTSVAKQRYQAIVGTLPSIAADGVTLRRLITFYGDLQKNSATPAGLYREISRALDAVPSADLESIVWQVGGDAGLNSRLKPSPLVPAGCEAAIVSGTINLPSNTTPRQLLQSFDRLVAALRANPKLEVSVLKRPFEIESGKSFSGGDDTISDPAQRAFALQVMRKITP